MTSSSRGSIPPMLSMATGRANAVPNTRRRLQVAASRCMAAAGPAAGVQSTHQHESGSRAYVKEKWQEGVRQKTRALWWLNM
jgi:hypothetical protein